MVRTDRALQTEPVSSLPGSLNQSHRRAQSFAKTRGHRRLARYVVRKPEPPAGHRDVTAQ